MLGTEESMIYSSDVRPISLKLAYDDFKVFLLLCKTFKYELYYSN